MFENIKTTLRALWNPAMYHGLGKGKNYFEGWFYKCVDKNGENIFAIIPGVSFGGIESDKHSFIQVLNGITGQVHYFIYKFEDFSGSKKDFEIRIGANVFSREGIKLDIDKDGVAIKGELKFEGLKPWPVSFLSPGIMGWYAFVPFMQCYHGVLSMDHVINGSLSYNNNTIDFTSGRGYTEKDWGQAFPESWIWMQSNHFDSPEVSLTASIAKIPWLGNYFTGYIAGLLYKGKLYRFTTYNGAVLEKITFQENVLRMNFIDKDYVLEIETGHAGGGNLKAPLPKTGMKGRVNESLKSIVRIKLFKKNGELIYEGKGLNTGLEINGDIERLIKGLE